MKIFFLFLIISITSLIGDTNNQITQVLSQLNNKSIKYHFSESKKNFYILKAGWNKVKSPKFGVNIIKSFKKNEDIKFIFVHDAVYDVWAGFSPDLELQKEMYSKRVLNLKYIEPNVSYFIYSKKDTTVKTVYTKISKTCQDLIDSSGYKLLLDSTFTKEVDVLKNDKISIKTKYFSHHKKGEYSDTRVLLLYPKLKLSETKNKFFKYGSAVPTIFLEYNEEYAGKEFFIYNYFDRTCYKGLFPSKKIPPFSTLMKLKEK